MLKNLIKNCYKLRERYFQRNDNCLSAIDILIPATVKDFLTLPYVVNYAIKNIQNPITSIFVIFPRGTMPCKDLRSVKNLYFVEEDFFKIDRSLFDNYIIGNLDRRGWLLQQFIKLSGNMLCTENKFLVLDADTVIIKKQSFEYKEKDILLFSDEYHQPYYSCFEKIFGYKTVDTISFVSHHMLFEKQFLQQMKQEIENKNHDQWIPAIIKNCDFSNPSCFSEYETYGHWMLKNNKRHIIRQYFYNKALPRECIKDIDNLLLHSQHLKSLSFHSYIKKNNMESI